MLKLNLTIEEELVLLQKYHLSPTELFLLRLLLIFQDDNDNQYILEYLSLNSEDTGKFRDVLSSLQNKDVILKSYNIPKEGTKLQLNELNKIPINKNVQKSIFKSSFEMGYELYEIYPSIIYVNGSAQAGQAVSKKFNTLEDAFRYYGKSIRWNPEKHREILELVQWAKENNVINFNLATFLVDQRWNYFQNLKEGDISGMTFDNCIDA